jgi:putative ABC transport system permease protein
MNLEKRAFLYLTRKKGKNLLLAIVFLLISFSLLAGSSVYLGIQQISKDLRSNIGASFSIRPYEQFDMDNGQVSSKGTPTIDEQSIQRVISAVGKELKCYNTEHSGYVKGEKLTFLAGAGHNEESNMGTVKAVRDSSLCQNFLDEEYELSVGEHIKPEDKDKILLVKLLQSRIIFLSEIRLPLPMQN